MLVRHGSLYLVAVVFVTSAAYPALAGPGAMAIKAVASRPAAKASADLARKVDKLRDAITQHPKQRRLRFELVQALSASGNAPAALKAAKLWRAHDAYNLLAVRMIGDLQAQLGDRAGALRTWSAVVELLPEDASAHRALASALKQAGELEAACGRLQRAVQLNGRDHRLVFELADCQHRIGDTRSAARLFGAIVADLDAPGLVRGPARQRLAQAWGQQLRHAVAAGDHTQAASLAARRKQLRVQGGLDSDIKVFLSWDTDRSDIDLWVTNPSGQRVWYRNKKGRLGDALFGDVTTGYGPEMYSARRAKSGVYKVQVNYYGTNRRGLREARGEVVIVTGEGRADGQRVALPYRLFEPGQTVTVAEITVP